MEKEENKSGSVYVTVDGYFNPIHISMKGKGKEGFWDFMQEDVEKALREKRYRQQAFYTMMCQTWQWSLLCGREITVTI